MSLLFWRRVDFWTWKELPFQLESYALTGVILWQATDLAAFPGFEKEALMKLTYPGPGELTPRRLGSRRSGHSIPHCEDRASASLFL